MPRSPGRVARRGGPVSPTSGFTLIELLIVVAIIGMLASMLVPNLLDAVDKAKQKRTVADMRVTGTAMMAWLSDQSSAAAAGSSSGTVTMTDYPLIDHDDLEAELVEQYIQDVPLRDGWKNFYEYRFEIGDPSADRIMAVRSGGKDGVLDAGSYTSGSFDPTDYDQDIVWTDGFFVRWPEKVN